MNIAKSPNASLWVPIPLLSFCQKGMGQQRSRVCEESQDQNKTYIGAGQIQTVSWMR